MDAKSAEIPKFLFRLPRIECWLARFELGKEFADCRKGWTMLFLLKYVFRHAGTTCPISAFLPFLSVGLEDYVSAFGANVEP